MKTYILGALLVASFAVFGFSVNTKTASAYLTCDPSSSQSICSRRECSAVGASTTECDGDGNTYSKFKCYGNGVFGECTGIATGGDIGANTAVDSMLSPNTTYYWRVKAGNAFGQSSWSNTFNFKTAAPSTIVSAKPGSVSSGAVYSSSYMNQPRFNFDATGRVLNLLKVIFGDTGAEPNEEIVGCNPGSSLPSGISCCKQGPPAVPWVIVWSGGCSNGGGTTGVTVNQ